MSNEANGLLPLCAMVERSTCGFSFVNRTQQRVRGLPTGSSWYVRAAAGMYVYGPDQWMEVLWDGDGVSLSTVDRHTPVKTIPSPFHQNVGDNKPQTISPLIWVFNAMLSLQIPT